MIIFHRTPRLAQGILLDGASSTSSSSSSTLLDDNNDDWSNITGLDYLTYLTSYHAFDTYSSSLPSERYHDTMNQAVRQGEFNYSTSTFFSSKGKLKNLLYGEVVKLDTVGDKAWRFTIDSYSADIVTQTFPIGGPLLALSVPNDDYSMRNNCKKDYPQEFLDFMSSPSSSQVLDNANEIYTLLCKDEPIEYISAIKQFKKTPTEEESKSDRASLPDSARLASALSFTVAMNDPSTGSVTVNGSSSRGHMLAYLFEPPSHKIALQEQSCIAMIRSRVWIIYTAIMPLIHHLLEYKPQCFDVAQSFCRGDSTTKYSNVSPTSLRDDIKQFVSSIDKNNTTSTESVILAIRYFGLHRVVNSPCTTSFNELIDSPPTSITTYLGRLFIHISSLSHYNLLAALYLPYNLHVMYKYLASVAHPSSFSTSNRTKWNQIVQHRTFPIYKTLNSYQKILFHAIVDSYVGPFEPSSPQLEIGQSRPNLPFLQPVTPITPIMTIHGPPGTGKSQLINAITGHLIDRSERILVTCHSNTAIDQLLDRFIKEFHGTTSTTIATTTTRKDDITSQPSIIPADHGDDSYQPQPGSSIESEENEIDIATEHTIKSPEISLQQHNLSYVPLVRLGSLNKDHHLHQYTLTHHVKSTEQSIKSLQNILESEYCEAIDRPSTITSTYRNIIIEQSKQNNKQRSLKNVIQRQHNNSIQNTFIKIPVTIEDVRHDLSNLSDCISSMISLNESIKHTLLQRIIVDCDDTIREPNKNDNENVPADLSLNQDSWPILGQDSDTKESLNEPKIDDIVDTSKLFLSLVVDQAKKNHRSFVGFLQYIIPRVSLHDENHGIASPLCESYHTKLSIYKYLSPNILSRLPLPHLIRNLFHALTRLNTRETWLNYCPLIAGTLYGVGRDLTVPQYQLSPDKYDPQYSFDTVIVDEAGQSSEISMMSALVLSKRLILAGDHLQLSPVASHQRSIYDGYTISLMERIYRQNMETFKSKSKNRQTIKHYELDYNGKQSIYPLAHFPHTSTLPFVSLEQQYRMNRMLSEWIRKATYHDINYRPGTVHVASNTLLNPTHRSLIYHRHGKNSILPIYDSDLYHPIIWIDTFDIAKQFSSNDQYQGKMNYCEQLTKQPGIEYFDKSSTSYVNIYEGWIALQHTIRLIYSNIDQARIKIVVPYKASVNTFRHLFDSYCLQDVSIGTVDSLQGSESDVVIYCIIRSNNMHKLGFVKDSKRLNVALSRAKQQVCVIGNSDTAKSAYYLNKLYKSADKGTDDKIIIYPSLEYLAQTPDRNIQSYHKGDIHQPYQHSRSSFSLTREIRDDISRYTQLK